MEWKVRQTGYYVRMSYLLLFLVFVLCGIFTILAGGKVYVNMNSRRAEQYSSSVALHYIANQVRQGDGEDIIKVIEADAPARFLSNSNIDVPSASITFIISSPSP